MRPRYFTVEEANALLPRVSELLSQMREAKARHDRLLEEVEEFSRYVSANGHVIEKRLNEARQELAGAATEVNTLIERLREIGCEVKDLDEGLVDFRAERDGREVYLCWKLGEPEVLWWHELNSGFGGRRPLDE